MFYILQLFHFASTKAVNVMDLTPPCVAMTLNNISDYRNFMANYRFFGRLLSASNRRL